MKYASTFLIVVSTVSLLACDKPAEAPAPAAPPPVAEAPQVESAPAAAPAPAAQPEAAQPAATTATAKPALAQPAPVAKPASAAAPDATQPDLAHGQQIYRQACAFCHEKGVAGAPKAGDTAAWSPRLAQGMDALYASALRGKGGMPAKGGNPALAEPDVKAAVDYLAAQSR